jgi:hypothetical protein
MKSVQMGAARLPPNPFAMGMFPPGKPTQTAVESRGVYPTNQAFERFSAVPVLPAAGQP